MRRPAHVTAAFLVVLGLSLMFLGWLLWSFVGPIVLALVLVTLFQPLHRRLVRRMGGRQALAAGLTTALIVMGVIVPVGFFIAALSRQAYGLYLSSREGPVLEEVLALLSGKGVVGMKLHGWLEPLGIRFRPEALGEAVGASLTELGLGMYQRITGVAANAFAVVLQFAIMILLVFTMLVHGGRIKRYLMDLSPLPDDEEEALVSRFQAITRAVFLGNGLGSLLQGICGGVGFMLFGLGSATLWGTAIGLLSFLPVIGGSLVFVPAAGYLLVTGRVGAALAFLIYNLAYTTVIEYGVKPRLIGNNSQMNAVLVFLSIVGGLRAFGVLGLFYGPLIAAIFLALVDIYQERYRAPECPKLVSREDDVATG